MFLYLHNILRNVVAISELFLHGATNIYINIFMRKSFRRAQKYWDGNQPKLLILIIIHAIFMKIANTRNFCDTFDKIMKLEKGAHQKFSLPSDKTKYKKNNDIAIWEEYENISSIDIFSIH